MKSTSPALGTKPAGVPSELQTHWRKPTRAYTQTWKDLYPLTRLLLTSHLDPQKGN